jgi:RNA polymerase-binding transcription factor DksA
MTRATAKQIETLASELIAQRAILVASAHDALARSREHPMGELAGDVPDVGDESVAALVTDLTNAVLQRRVAAVRDIDAALSRIQDGRYATCIDCGDDIDAARLAAFPTATRCVACQGYRERTFAGCATPRL